MNDNPTASRCFERLNLGAIVKAIANLTLWHDSRRKFEGGVLAILVKGPDGSTYEARHIGEPGEKIPEFAFFANEKIHRLHYRRGFMNRPEECASSQSEYIPEEKYGGCIVAWNEQYEIFISFSGAPAVVDEVAVYTIAKYLGFNVDCRYTNIYLKNAGTLLQDCVIHSGDGEDPYPSTH